MDRTTRWALLLILLAAGCGSDTKPPVAAPSSNSSAAPTSTTSRARNPRLVQPNAVLTPGATIADITAETVCADGYAQSVESVSVQVTDQVFAAYGLIDVNRDEFELDHLVPIELGGSNDIKNLWPEPKLEAGQNGAVDKNAIEAQLRDAVCAHHLKLPDAQAAVLHWDTVNFGLLVTTTTAPRSTAPLTQPSTTSASAP